MQGYSSVLLLLGLLGQAQADHPTARHQLVVVDSADSVVIRLQSYSKQILKNGVLSNENVCGFCNIPSLSDLIADAYA